MLIATGHLLNLFTPSTPRTQAGAVLHFVVHRFHGLATSQTTECSQRRITDTLLSCKLRGAGFVAEQMCFSPRHKLFATQRAFLLDWTEPGLIASMKLDALL
jgi:hypothetical protein